MGEESNFIVEKLDRFLNLVINVNIINMRQAASCNTFLGGLERTLLTSVTFLLDMLTSIKSKHQTSLKYYRFYKLSALLPELILNVNLIHPRVT